MHSPPSDPIAEDGIFYLKIFCRKLDFPTLALMMKKWTSSPEGEMRSDLVEKNGSCYFIVSEGKKKDSNISAMMKNRL